MDTAGDICTAIAQRRFLQFEDNGRWRVAYPCAHGWLYSGNEALRAHEVSLRDGRVTVRPGRLYLIKRITGTAVTDQPFEEPPAGYRRGDRGMETIHCQL